tara:strand:- start:75 stop:560 length:486 start_codon:yes stop_codon:yes gene_type:complete
MKSLKTKLAFAVMMLALSIVTVYATVENTTTTNNDDEQGIVFVKGNWDSIIKKAKAENKVIFFDAYTTWCGPCKLLQKNVFTREDVAKVFNKEFINVKFDMESGEGLMLAKKYPVEGYPTLFFIAPDGSVVKEVIGYQKPETLLKIAKQIKVPNQVSENSK